MITSTGGCLMMLDDNSNMRMPEDMGGQLEKKNFSHF